MQTRRLVAAAGALGVNALAIGALLATATGASREPSPVSPVVARLIEPPAAARVEPEPPPPKVEPPPQTPAPAQSAAPGERRAVATPRQGPSEALARPTATTPVPAPRGPDGPAASSRDAPHPSTASAPPSSAPATLAPPPASMSPSLQGPPPAYLASGTAQPALAAALPPAAYPVAATGSAGHGGAPSAPGPLASAAPASDAVGRTGPRVDASWSGNSAPPYPASSRRMGEQGEVRLDVHVGADGSVLEVRLRASSGSATLDRTAIETVRRWRFRPATVDGQPVPEWYRDWKWVFRLEG